MHPADPARGCCPAWIVWVETPVMVSCFELVEGVLSGVITRDQALRVACERGGTEADARRELNWAKAAVDYADPAATTAAQLARGGAIMASHTCLLCGEGTCHG